MYAGRWKLGFSSAAGCKTGFQNLNDIMDGLKKTFDGDETLEHNPLAKVYNVGFSVLLVYSLFF